MSDGAADDDLHSLAADIARLLGPAMPKGVAFCMILVDTTTSHVGYAVSGRADVHDILRAVRDKLDPQ